MHPLDSIDDCPVNQHIKDIAIQKGIYDCLLDPYDQLENGDPYSSVLFDLERFAHEIVKECCRAVEQESSAEVGETVRTILTNHFEFRGRIYE